MQLKGINEINADQLKSWDTSTEIDGIWVAARPVGLGGIFYRFKMAYLVFTGKADVVRWYKQ